VTNQRNASVLGCSGQHWTACVFVCAFMCVCVLGVYACVCGVHQCLCACAHVHVCCVYACLSVRNASVHVCICVCMCVSV
jgi:hypothetical protein